MAVFVDFRRALLLSTGVFLLAHAAPPDVRNSENREKVMQQLPAPQKASIKQPELAAPPSHLEAVPLERDGALNKRFRAELVLGEDTHEHHGPMRHEESEDAGRLVEKLFERADVDKDGKVSRTELENVIIANINHHLDESMNDAKETFKALDQNDDVCQQANTHAGILTWDEFHFHFLIANKLMDEKDAKDHDEDNHENLMHMKFSEKIAMDKENWDKVDFDKSGGLDEKEFLAFRHPEHNSIALTEMAGNLIASMDSDGDNRLSEKEFSAPAAGQVDEKWLETEKKFIEHRVQEFRDHIDTNNDGQADLAELAVYMNARHPSHARQEADEIMQLADTDGDGQLSLDELMDKKEYMHDTGVFHPERRMHEDL